jgi:ABC-2 type transport system ATP-binding protein
LNQELFLGLIQELRAQGSAVLLSAHQLNLVERLCDRFSLISRGRVLLTGTLEEIRRRAAGGAGEVLLVDLRPAIGRRVDAASIEAVLGEIGSRATVETRELSDGLVRIEASLPPGTDLSPILGELSRRFAIERVGTRTLSLHEIYVRAVGADHAPSPETSPEAARV